MGGSAQSPRGLEQRLGTTIKVGNLVGHRLLARDYTRTPVTFNHFAQVGAKSGTLGE
jgi:hypothetical protein